MTSIAEWSGTTHNDAPVTDADISLTVLVRQWMAMPEAAKAGASSDADRVRLPMRVPAMERVPDRGLHASPRPPLPRRCPQVHRQSTPRWAVLMSSLAHVGTPQVGKHRFGPRQPQAA